MTFLELYSELIHRFPTLSPFLAKRFINRAREDVYRSRRWSFLIAEGALTVPDTISAGTCEVTQHSDVVTPSAEGVSALDAAGTNPLVSKRQFSLGAGSPIYSISSYVDGVITLDRPYREASDAAASYKVFTCYFDAPAQDFTGFISVKDIQNNYNLRLHCSYKDINSLDPQRSITGDPLNLASYKPGTNGSPRFELWPTPTTAKSYHCIYQRRGVDLTDDSETLPSVIPDALIVERASFYTYQWAMQTGLRPNNQAVDWRFLMAQSTTNYMEELKRSSREDNEAYEEMIVNLRANNGYLSPMMDTNYAQNHITDW